MAAAQLSRERWSQVEPLLDAALELEPARRSAFLDEMCRTDPALRAEVAALLLACDRGRGILSAPATVAYAPLLATLPPELPQQLGGRYSIVREIGQGGMATVYLAADTKHSRQVAVKVLHADVERLIGRERFLREIEIAAGLSHPHILPLHDSGEVASGRGDEVSFLYFVSPFVAGESLRDRLHREGRLTAAETARLGAEIALALDYAHRQGVVHLDVKPGNILLQDGHAVIADFGIARAMSHAGDDDLAGAMPLLGTPSYMSPEQALRAADVDGRSDVYSLGCVLYEMVTGQRPFARETADDALVRARAELVPDPYEIQQYASPALVAVILQAMAPERDIRFPTAGELARALSDAVHAKKSPGTKRPRVIAGAVAAIVAVSALGAGLLAARHHTVLDADLIAVAPFDVEGPSLALWKEGLVDVLSRNLDGAGALRAVPATVVVRQWQGRADAQSARLLAQRTGARLVLFGGLLTAHDSVRATAVLYDAVTGRTLAEIEQRDDSARIDRLSDSLTVAVLRDLGHSRQIDMARAASSPTTSLSALKAYLQGEQFYRAAHWDSAEARFDRALRLDTTFALAYHRLAAVRTWRDPRDIPDSATYALMRRTSHFTHGLGPRERLLATVDSLSAEASFAWRRGLRQVSNYTDEEAIARKLFTTLNDGLRRYPNDPELSFLLADAHSRYDGDVVPGEVDDRASLAFYDRAIALDSSFAPAYVRPIRLAAYLDGAASARRYIGAYLAVPLAGSHSQFIRLADALLDPSRAASVDFTRLVDTLPADGLCEVSALLRHIPDSAETIVRFAQALANQPTPTSSTFSRPSCAFVHAIDGLQFRGHLREALRLTSLDEHGMQTTVLYNMARAGMVPAAEARAEFKHFLSLAPKSRFSKLYGWWATDGDTLAIQTYIDGFGAAENILRSPAGLAMLRASVAAGRAYLALAKRDTSSALRQLLTTRDTLHESWYDNRIALVQLLVAAGRYPEAAARLERRWPGTSVSSNGFDDVIWTMERARVFERLGRRDEAVANYTFVIDAWRTADTELQPYVRESREALVRLGAARRDGAPIASSSSIDY